MVKNIALIGFMACGKTTLGRILATEMKYTFVDIDKKIELAEGKKISEIFTQNGEEYFRSLETQVLEEFASKDRVVISTGGGIISRPENLEILRRDSFVAFLDVPFDILASRVAEGSSRPLFQNVQTAYELWKSRYPLYRSVADSIYSKHDEILLRSAREIMNSFYKFRKKHS